MRDLLVPGFVLRPSWGSAPITIPSHRMQRKVLGLAGGSIFSMPWLLTFCAPPTGTRACKLLLQLALGHVCRRTVTPSQHPSRTNRRAPARKVKLTVSRAPRTMRSPPCNALDHLFRGRRLGSDVTDLSWIALDPSYPVCHHWTVIFILLYKFEAFFWGRYKYEVFNDHFPHEKDWEKWTHVLRKCRPLDRSSS